MVKEPQRLKPHACQLGKCRLVKSAAHIKVASSSDALLVSFFGLSNPDCVHGAQQKNANLHRGTESERSNDRTKIPADQ